MFKKYSRQFSAFIKINHKMKTNFVRPEGPKAQDNKTGFDYMIFILIFVEICLQYDAIHDFSVWL